MKAFLEREKGRGTDAPTVSVIIPVYNVSSCLWRCLDSVLSQTYRNMEIILVDDGSTDDSGEICDAFAARDGRIKVLHQENGGLSAARNAGLEMMSGEYVTFIDSDDYVNRKYVEILTACAVSGDLDLVISGSVKFPDGTEPCMDKTDAAEEGPVLYTARETAEQMMYRRITMYAHGRLYRSRLFEKIRFPIGKFFEDIPTTWQVLKQADSIAYIKRPLYYYRQRMGSIVRDGNVHHRMDQVSFVKRIVDEVREDAVLYQAAVFRYFFALMDVYAQMGGEKRRYQGERAFLEAEIKKYRNAVLRNTKGDIGIRGLAALAYLSPAFLRRAAQRGQKIKQAECRLLNRCRCGNLL